MRIRIPYVLFVQVDASAWVSDMLVIEERGVLRT